MREAEALQVRQHVQALIAPGEFGTLAIDGRQMKEHADKAGLSNFAWFARGQETSL